MKQNLNQITEFINNIMNKMRDLYALKRRELTVTSLSSCLKMSYYYVMYGKNVSEKMVWGTEHHAFFQRHFVELLEENGFTCLPEHEVKYWRLRGRVDLLCISRDGLNVIFEFKFTTLPFKSNPFYPFWYRQLKYYVALEKVQTEYETIGVLIVSSFALDKWLIDVVEVEDPLEVVREMDRRYQELEEALAKNVPPAPERGKWCDYCIWKQTCFNQQLA